MSIQVIVGSCAPGSRIQNTANLPDEALESMTSVTTTGIYFGYARVHPLIASTGELGDVKDEELETSPMVMSLGWNPFYKNEKLTAVRHFTSSFRHSLKTFMP